MLNSKEIKETALSMLPDMRGMFAKMATCEADIDDAVQDGYIHLIVYALPKWRGEGSLKTYAMTAAKRCYLRERSRHFNSRRKSFPQENGDWGTESTRHLIDHEAADALGRAIQLEWLAVALESLTGREQALCDAYKATGKWSLAAERIGVSRVTASRMLQAIVAKLAKLDDDE